jgi:hypothetical protein
MTQSFFLQRDELFQDDDFLAAWLVTGEKRREIKGGED